MVSFLYLFYFFLSQETISVSAIQRVYPETADSSAIGPSINDPTLMTELYFRGLSYPTDMEFIDRDYILVTEKDTDIVQRIINGTMLHEPLLDVNVATAGHRGMSEI